MNDYSIKLGINFDDGELKNIKKQLTNLTDNTHRIRIDIDNSRLLKQISHAKKELKELNSTKGNQPSLTVNTQSLEKSLSRVADVIDEVRKSLGTLDDKSGMKSLVDSVNQIATALGKVENESDSLLKSLSALSKKDFSVNFDLKMGKSASQISSEQGDIKRDAISQLKQQAKALEDYLDQYYKVTQRQEGVVKLTQGTNLFSSFWEMSPNIGNTKASLKQQVSTYKQYIDLMQEAAKIKGVDLSSVTSGFSKTTNDIVEETKKVSDGVEEAKQALKGIFGGSLDVEGLSGQLQPIITDLGEIKTVLQSLSSNNAIDGLTQSFNRLSETLEKLTANLTLAKNTLDTGFSNVAPVNNAVKTAQQTGQKIGEAVGKSATQSAKQSINIDDVIDEQVLKLMNEYAIAGGKGSKAFDEIRQSLVDFRNGSGDINKVTSAISNNMKVVDEAKNDYKELADHIKMFNASGAKVHIPDSIRQEYGDDYKSMRSQLGKAFTSGKGMDFETFIEETNSILGQTIDLSQGAEAAFGDLVRKVNSTKGGKFLTGDDLFRSGVLDMGDVVANVVASLEQIENVEEEIARTSTTTANTVVQNEERKQQAYQETAKEFLAIQKGSFQRAFSPAGEEFGGINNTAQSVEGYFKSLNGVLSDTVSVQERFDADKNLNGFTVSLKNANGAAEQLRYTLRTVEDGAAFFEYTGGSINDNGVLKQMNAISAKADTLQNKLDKLKSSYSDQNVSRPIKDDGHITALSEQYDKVEKAIIGVRNADESTFASMVSNAQREITTLETMVSEFKNAENVASKMKSTDFASGLDIAKNNLGKLKAEAKDFPQITQTIENLDKAIKGVGDASALNKFNDQLRVARSELAKIKSETSEANKMAAFAKEIEIDLNAGEFSTKVQKIHSDAKKLSKVTDELRIKLDALDDAENAMNLAFKNGSVDEKIAAYRKYELALQNVENQLKRNTTEEQNANNLTKLNQSKQALSLEMSNWLKDNSAAAKDFGARIKELQVQIDACDKNGLGNLRREFQNIKKEAQAAGKTTKTLGDRIKEQFAQYSTYLGVAELFMWAEQGLRSMFEQIKLIDSAMTELKKVTDETDASYNRFLSNAASRAKEIGTTIDGLVSSTADFARLGYGFADAQGLAEVANIYAVVGDEVEGVEGATESLISTMAAFKGEMNGMNNTDFAMSIIDKLNEVANNYSITSGGLGEALQRSASSLEAGNNTLDESISLITAANEVVQNPEKVGNAMKTISMRIRSAKSEMEEMGENTDGMVESTATLRNEIKALSGVDIMASATEFKSTYQILDELSQKWEGLSDIAQATIIEKMAGKHQGNIFASLMENFDTARNTLETSLNSSGSALAEHSKWSQSLEAQLLKLQAAWQGLSQAFLSSDFLKGALNAVIGLVDGITTLIDTIGTLPTLAFAFAAFESFKGVGFFKTIEDQAKLSGKRITNIFSDAVRQATKTFQNIGLQKDSSFKASIDADKAALNEYTKMLDQASKLGVKIDDNAFNKIFENASNSAKEFAKSGKLASEGIDAFVDSQKAAQVATLAQNKSLGNASAIIREYYGGCKNVQMGQTAFADAVKQTNPQLATALTTSNNAAGAMVKYTGTLVAAKAASVGLQIATTALNAVIGMGIGALISVAISGITKWINKNEELADKVDEITSKFKEEHDALSKLKGDYDTSNESSMISKYEKLSKGVDNLGRNVSLTADEYSEYQSIVNTIADQIPSLISGYDAQGNALLSVKGNVEEVTKAYENLIKAQNNEVLTNAGDIAKDFGNAVKDAEKNTENFGWTRKISTDAAKIWQDLLLSNDQNEFEQMVGNAPYRGAAVEGLHIEDLYGLSAALEKAGLERNYGSQWNPFDGETDSEYITRAFKEHRDIVVRVLDDFYTDIEAETEGMKSVAQAALSNAFDISDSEYYGMSDTMKNVAKQIVNGFDYEFFAGLQEDGTSVTTYINNMLAELNAISDADNATIEAAFNLQTQFNGGEIDYGKYVDRIRNVNNLIDSLNVSSEIKSQLKLALNTDEVIEEYDALVNRLTSKEIGWDDKTAKNFLNSLSAEEFDVAMDIIPTLDAGATIDEVQALIDEKLATEFKFDIAVQTAGIEAFNTALTESRSAAGLTSESIAALKARYEDLDGFNAAALFEKTANGIHLNSEELSRLEEQYISTNKLDIEKNLNTLVTKYNDLTEEIKGCTDAQEKEKLQLQADAYKDKIDELSTLSSQYDGLTSAFAKWQTALEGAEEGDNYDSLYENLEGIKELYDKGLVGTDKFKTAVQLMTNKDLSGADIDEIVSAYKKGYPKMQRYFTEGQKGCKRFLNDVHNLNSEWAHMNKDGSWEINFNAEEVAKELGVSVDFVLQIAKKLKDYGFEVNLEDSSVDNLQTKIEQTEAKLKELGQAPVDINVDIEASSENIGKIESEIEKAKSKINEINNSSVSPEVKTAQLEDARAKLEALIQKKQEASQPAFMSLNTSQVNASLVDALEKVQEYQTAINNLNMLLELKEAGIVIDDSQIDAAQQKVDECAKAIQGLDGDVKLAIGLEEDGSIDSIKKAFEDGKVHIDANTDPALTKIEQLAENVERIEDKDVTINVTVNGLDDVKELNRNIDLATNIDGDIDKLSEYVENAKTLKELGGNIASYVTAEVKGNVLDKKDKELKKLEIFANGAKDLKSGNIISNVTANTLGNVFEEKEKNIDNLKVFIDSAKGIKEIEGDIVSNITANTLGSVFENKSEEKYIDNLKTFIDSAKGIKDIEGDITSNITANTLGSVFENKNEDKYIDNLKTYVDSAKGIKDIEGNIISSITANTLGSVFENKNEDKYIDNLKTYIDSAKGIKDIEGNIVSNITANTLGSVFEDKEKNIDNVRTFIDSAKGIKDIEGDIVSNITANTLGSVFEDKEKTIDNLDVFVESAKGIKEIQGDIVSNITANTLGSVFEDTERTIDNLGVFVESAKGIKDIQGDIVSNITANVDGNVVGDRTEAKINNLKVFTDSAKDIKTLEGEISSKITANVEGNVFEKTEGKINNLKTFVDSAKGFQNKDLTSTVTAEIKGNVFTKTEGAINNLDVFVDSAKGFQNKDLTSTVTANVKGNVVEGEGASSRLSSLTEFKSLVNGMTNQDVSVSVTAKVDSENVNKAIQLLKDVSSSGVFKDYSATVQVGATIATIDDTTVKNYQAPPKEGKVSYSVDPASSVYTWTAPSKNGVVNYEAEVEALTYAQRNKTGTITYKAKIEGGSPAAGTASPKGSSFSSGSSGRAFARGDWGIKGNGVALGGERGMELVVRDGKFFTIGDEGAQFFRYKKNDIVFNAAQTESLFKYGGIKGANPRGKMLASGTAFAGGNAFVTGGGKFHNSVTGGSYGSNDSSSDKDFKEVIDWIEVIINRIERAIDKFDQQTNNIYKSWSSRNTALINQTVKVQEEIELQQKAYEKYLSAAEGVGLSSAWAEKVRNGKIDIETIKDESLKEKIDDYENWHSKALDAKDAIEELREEESKLYAQRFENIQTQYDGILQGYEHTEAMLNEYISQAEEQGFVVSKKYYDSLIVNEKSKIAELKKEQAELIAERDNAVAEGKITKGSEAWFEQCAAIDEVTQAIEESTTALLEFDNAMRDIDWSIFDLIQERISGVTAEADFLIELMSNKKLFDDDGKLTSQGLATMALHSQNYNTYMYQADEYGAEVAKLDAQIAKDPYDQELINRRNELIEAQRESILAAEDEKNAIRDIVEDGINLELDALQELIDKKNEALESERDLYEYQKKVKEQTEEIASLEKQMAAYSGDDSEEAKQKVQQIKVDLEAARQDLKETEYDKFIDDTSAMLDTLYNEYELILNTRLDNIDYLLESVIESINAAASADGNIATALGSEGAISIAVSNNATSIKDTLTSETNKVGTTLSNAMNSIWNTGDGNAKSVLTMYGEDFRTKSTTVITTLNGIKSIVNTMVSSLNKEATTKTTTNKTTTSAQKNPTTTTTTKKPTTTTKKTSSSGDGKLKVGDKVKFVSGQYYNDSQGKKPLGSKLLGKNVYVTKISDHSWSTHPIHIARDKAGKRPLGWLKKSQISGYATGKQNFLDDEIAWTQENGQEFIVRPSDGAILTPVAKGDSVLTAAASNNIWDMANSPAEFIKDNLGIGSANVPNNSNVNNSVVQNFENITFSLPNVHGYNDLLREMQSDPKFEKLVLSMTVDRIAGRSKLAKGKSIRN